MAAPASFVIDCSVSVAWLIETQADAYTEAALDALTASYAVAPQWWNIEVLNVLLSLQRRGKLAASKSVELLRYLQRLPIRVHQSQSSTFELHALALRHQLSSYDALYLDTALAIGLPLATRDKALQQAAIESGVGVWGA